MKGFNYWLKELENLHPLRKGNLIAPHKAVLMLALLDLADVGLLCDGFVKISEPLLRAFEENWRRYVPSDSPFKCNLQNPFFHLKYCSWWRLVGKPGEVVNFKEVASMAALKRNFLGARIEPGMLAALMDPNFRVKARLKLISTYLVGADETDRGPAGEMQTPDRDAEYQLPLFFDALEAAEPEVTGKAV